MNEAPLAERAGEARLDGANEARGPGGFSAAAVAAPSFIRFMLLAALGYAAVRTAWGLWRA